MNLVATLIINKKYFTQEEIRQTVKDIETYINHLEKLIILNISGYEINSLVEKLNRYTNVSVKNDIDKGQVYNYHMALNYANQEKANFAIILELGYYYGEDDLLELKRYAIGHPDACVITPYPIYACETEKKVDYHDREIFGCKLIGTLINMNIYKERGFLEKYYQTTFDYEYCLYHRSKGRKIILLPNVTLYNTNYKVIEKRVFFMKTYSYDRDLLDVYYETRNRLYLWEEYKNIDPDYVALDKKEYKKEVKEMRLKDKNFHQKRLMIECAKIDYLKKIIGKKSEF